MVRFVGTVTKVENTRFQITVRGQDENDGDNEAAAERTFTVSPSCHIESASSPSGTLADLHEGEKVRISYTKSASTYTATSIVPGGGAGKNKAEGVKQDKKGHKKN